VLQELWGVGRQGEMECEWVGGRSGGRDVGECGGREGLWEVDGGREGMEVVRLRKKKKKKEEEEEERVK
jgi:hypothetical protein